MPPNASSSNPRVSQQLFQKICRTVPAFDAFHQGTANNHTIHVRSQLRHLLSSTDSKTRHHGARYQSAYFNRFPGVWCHGDWIEQTEDGGFIIYGRSDATLNPGGVRIGTAEIYRQVEQLDEILESIVVGQDWMGDVRVVLFCRLRKGIELNEHLTKKIKRHIRDRCTPRHVPAKVLAVADIPRTKSGKITELAVRKIIHGQPIQNREALANPEALDLYIDLPELQH
jgi:acetoacetyl-CoA synthetase